MSNDSSPISDPVSGANPPSYSVGPPTVTPPTVQAKTQDANHSADADGSKSAASVVQSSATQRDIESELVDQTKTQIRTLVQEIATLAKSSCSKEDFFEGFLTRTTSALASLGGAIWLRESNDDPLKLQYHINLKRTSLATDKSAQSQHSLLLNKLLQQGEPTLVSPNSGSDNSAEAGNPTEHLLVFGPIQINNETVGLVEILQRPNSGPATQRGYLRFVTQMAELAGEFLTNQQLRTFGEQQAMWQQLEHFIRSVHQGLDPRQTIYTIANEGRRLIDADRLSVATGTGRNCRVEAVSGLDSIERRAEQVKNLGRLAATVIRAGQPLWFGGDDTELPPQIEKRLHEYVDKSHSKMLAIIPLKESHIDPNQESSRDFAKPIGALIIEQLKDSRITSALQQRAEIVATHSETALTNALDHHGIFLMPVWKTLGKITSAFRGGRLAKTLTIVGGLAGLFAFLAIFPYPFGLGAKGSLVPEVQHEVFAQVDGVLQEVFVSDTDDTIVRKGQPLARMTNNDLMVEIENLRGKIQEAHEKLNTNQIIQSQKRLEQVDRQMIAGEINSAMQTIKSLTNELGLKEDEARLLQVVSPADGRVVNWQVRQNLLRRPVLRGQNLMTIIDPDTHWQVELELPEKRLAHLMKAQANDSEPLEVTFGLVSHPGVEYRGYVLQIDQKLDVHSDDGNTALLRIAFDNDNVSPDLLRSGTRVTAKVHCGTRSIGYVMFHELIETVQSSVFLWL